MARAREFIFKRKNIFCVGLVRLSSCFDERQKMQIPCNVGGFVGARFRPTPRSGCKESFFEIMNEEC